MASQYSFDSPSMRSNSPMINYRKDAKKGVKFTLMVVGESGTGKTTFINSLLGKKVVPHRFEPEFEGSGDTKTLMFTSAKSIALPNTSVLTRNEFNPSTAHEEPGFAITETKVEIIDDDNTKVQLNILDAPGFGDNLNNEICFVEIENYLKQQFDLVLAEETRIKRNPRFVDTRVHALLYFVTATGHGLREIDINCMKRLAKYVNIIPVISKADSFTRSELQTFKENIKYDIEKFNVPVFQFDNALSEYDEDEDRELIEECKFFTSLQPFAIISSENEFEIKDPTTGKSRIIRARQYPWGLVDINNTAYSDFPILRSVILGSHLQDLKDLTHDFLYETYRTERLMKVTGGVNGPEEDGGNYEEELGKLSSIGDKASSTVPSLSNLAQLTSSTNNLMKRDDSSVISATSSQGPRSMLLDDTDTIELPSPKIKDNQSLSSASTISLEGANTKSSNTSNQAFKRYSIGPQRSTLRQISETVPYVIRHERILERQQKLEEMEMKSAKELAARAALLEKKAAELKSREKSLMKRGGSENSRPESFTSSQDGSMADDPARMSSIRKEETFTDLHSIVSKK
ncbi:Piso0_002834 [Millerozyma farinosa CBS 7064]|uniref:Piso0_002834 protein n=1 Tax=Pichia sorbitophila (strain ATCC MYA-4447 / BCRC 22081 / CBS 7064 / NBRC 10061 / NRRL Y-12695) TaxID=559304 RepID=G8YDM8_PICSO|nr:Piso0_002834 [Millerozyma farinosa CBS 7064]